MPTDASARLPDGRDPVGRPGHLERRVDRDWQSEGGKAVRDRATDDVQRRATDEGRQDHDPDALGIDFDAVHDPEIDHGQDGQLGIRDLV